MTKILGKSIATAEQMATYLLSKNPDPKINIPVLAFCRLFLYMGALEGVRGDLEFARSCWETNHFKFTGTVVPEQNNYCGHGTTSSTNKGSYFPDEATGMLAQIQHAKGYATSEPLNYECLDTRYKYVKLGSAPNMEDMGGKWAVPGYDTKKYASLEAANTAKDSYGYKIVYILNEILSVGTEEADKPEEEKTETPKEEPLAGKKICIDAGHYGKYNRCPNNKAYYESDMTWKLHLLQKKYLEQLGAEVITTRPNQATDLALHARGTAARNCDLFISDHSNAVGSYMNELVDYVAVYHLTADTTTECDDISKTIAKALAPVIADVMGTKQGYKILTRQADYDRNSDGIMNDNYYGVLHGARTVETPGLILEHSFHTNSTTVNWLLDDANLDRLARAEAQAIAKYFSGINVEVKEDSDVPYCIRVANVPENDVLYIRKEPNANATKTGELAYNNPNKFTIVAEQNGWGKLKSSIGWINLKYTVRV